ncbi:MAG: PepSY domain-containing protein, partial [Deltaproteobacteria bacterium]|nr:PepSY domain-containing protein [Deltaproteobacteria bacterium]
FVERIDFSEEKIINFETYSKKVSLSKERALKIASFYATRFYRDFDTKKMQLVSADLIDHHFAREYRFVWEQLIDGVETPNCVMISINPATGKILTYIGLSRDIEVSLIPSVTQESALDIAVSQFPSIVPADSEATLRIDYPEKDDQRLVWMVEIQGEPVENVMQGGLVAIDAQTGEVLVVGPYA